MVFEGDYYSNEEENNLYWDVKDFNWLRTLRKSPNFVVVSDTKESTDGVVVCEMKSEIEVSAVETVSVEEEEDSEDEL